MDVNTIIQVINGVGFPIFACCAMGYFIVWDKKNRTQDRKDSWEKQAQMMETINATVANNTRTVERLLEKMETMGVS